MLEQVFGGIGSDNSPAFSGNIWGKWNQLGSVLQNGGKEVFEDFNAFPPHTSTSGGSVSGALGRGTVFISQGGGIIDGNVVGASSVDLASDGDNESAVWGPNTGFWTVSADSGRILMFEARVYLSTIADTKNNFFCGMMAPGIVATGVPITTAGAIYDTNIIGYHRQEASTYGGYFDTVYKASGVAEVRNTKQQAVAAATWIKLGFVADLRIGQNTLKWFANNVELVTPALTRAALVATAFPKAVNLGPVIATMNATGTTPGSNKVDWIRAAMTAVDGD